METRICKNPGRALAENSAAAAPACDVVKGINQMVVVTCKLLFNSLKVSESPLRVQAVFYKQSNFHNNYASFSKPIQRHVILISLRNTLRLK